MLTSFSDFKRSLQKGRFESNYFLFGPDSYLVDAARNVLIQGMEKTHGGGALTDTLDLEEVSIDDVLNAARSLSMFGSHQIVQVRGVMKLRDTACKKLGDYLSKPNPTATLVFYAGDLDRDQRKKKIFEVLSTSTRVVELAAPDRRAMGEWIRAMGNKEGYSVEQDALEFVMEMQGNDVGRIIQEIEKARLYGGQQTLITLSMVKATSGFSGDHDLFEFLDAVCSKNKQKALRLVGEIFFEGRETFLAFWWFGLRLRQLLQAQELSGKFSPQIISRQVGIFPPRTAEKLLAQSKTFSRTSLEKALYRVGTVDDKIKRSSIDSRLLMEWLVHELTG
jgi:DNA polymerase-3 subunit delta